MRGDVDEADDSSEDVEDGPGEVDETLEADGGVCECLNSDDVDNIAISRDRFPAPTLSKCLFRQIWIRWERKTVQSFHRRANGAAELAVVPRTNRPESARTGPA